MDIIKRIKFPADFILILVIVSGMFFSKLAADAYKESLLVTGYQLSVDGQEWFIVEDKEALNDMLEVYKSSYTQNISLSVHFISIDFVQNVAVNEVKVEKERFTSLDIVKKKIYEVEKAAVYYTVVRGDSLWNIAIANKIPLSRIIKLNPQLIPDKIWAGNKILFEPMNPVLDVRVKLTSTMVEPVEYAVQYIRDKTLLQNTRIVVKKGVEGSKEVTYDISMQNGYEETVTVLNETQLVAPVGAIVKVGTKRTLLRVSGSNFGIVAGHLTSSYGWRTDPISGYRKFHSGLDISASIGTPVYAYAEGVVVEAGWNNLEGYHVVIRHGSGLSTAYLHLSKILVGVGQSIKVGQNIGRVGSTGYSTGPHLHFAVMRNGVIVNPWDYL
jgi:murein DD-endopeptidase MepM/ murein hydrolase activator NlpD